MLGCLKCSGGNFPLKQSRCPWVTPQACSDRHPVTLLRGGAACFTRWFVINLLKAGTFTGSQRSPGAQIHGNAARLTQTSAGSSVPSVSWEAPVPQAGGEGSPGARREQRVPAPGTAQAEPGGQGQGPSSLQPSERPAPTPAWWNSGLGRALGPAQPGASPAALAGVSALSSQGLHQLWGEHQGKVQ